jgi:hypothetical protein
MKKRIKGSGESRASLPLPLYFAIAIDFGYSLSDKLIKNGKTLTRITG